VRWNRTRRQPQPADGTITDRRNPNTAPDLSDDVLVAAALAQPEAFNLCYERYVRQVYRYCYLRLGSREAAEDATSQVFLEALAGLGRYRGGAFAGWLFRIAQHTVADSRRRTRRDKPLVPLAAADNVSDPTQQASDETLSIRAALQELPADQRAVIELQLAGWSSEQIGAALGKSASTIRMARARALKRLRVVLADEFTLQQGELTW
jgi:RNA polymerase sigma-70 factor (ECF subfamily)